MKKSGFKRIVALSVVGIMLLSMAGCFGKDKEGGSVAVEEAVKDYKEYVFKEEKFVECKSTEYGSADIEVGTNKIYSYYTEVEYAPYVPVEGGETEQELTEPKGTMSGTEAEVKVEVIDGPIEEVMPEVPVEGEDWVPEYDYSKSTTTIFITEYDFQGNQLDEYNVTLEENTYLSRFVFNDADSSMIGVMTSDYETHYLVKVSKEGEVLAKEEIKLKNPGDYFYANDILMDSNGTIYVASDTIVKIFDKDFKEVAEVTFKTSEWISNMYKTSDGKILVYVMEYSEAAEKASLYVIDENGLSAESYEDIKLPGNYYILFNSMDQEYDFYRRTDEGIFGHKLGTNDSTKIFGFIESDVLGSNVNDVVSLGENRFMVTEWDRESWRVEGFSVYAKVDPADVPDRSIITMGMEWMDSDVAGRILDFNKESDEYRIQIIDYSQYNTLDDYEQAEKQLNNDVITGNAPDIICMSDYMDAVNFMEKGLFTDLNKMIESDGEVKKEDMFANIVNALSLDDKMYAITPEFVFRTCYMKKSLTPADGKLSFDALRKIEQQNGGKTAFFEWSRESILYDIMGFGGTDYVNPRTGECNFGDDFVKALEYAAQYPETIEYDMDMDYTFYETMYRNNQALLSNGYISNFRDFNYNEKGNFGEEIVCVGFPGATEGNSVLSLSTLYMISDESENKEGAWSFLRQFLLDDYQSKTGSLPVMKSAFDKKAETEMQKEVYTDEFGEEHVWDETFWLNDEEIILEPISKDRVDYIRSCIENTDSVYYYDEDIMEIIEEEAGAFFAGQKTAKQVADIIQSRAQIYVNESR